MRWPPSTLHQVHCCIWFEKNKSVVRDFFKGGGLIYAEFDSKIIYIMFLHYYLLVCKISTVKTLALRYPSSIRLINHMT